MFSDAKATKHMKFRPFWWSARQTIAVLMYIKQFLFQARETCAFLVETQF